MEILNAIITWLMDHYPQVAGYMIAILIAGLVVFTVCKRLFKMDQFDKAIDNLATKTDVSAIQAIVTKIEPSLQDVRERFMKVEDRVETLWKDKFAPADSPRQLNDRGNVILVSSGIKEIVDSMKLELLAKVREQNPATAYDAERITEEIVANLPKSNPELLPKFKDGAFRTGVDIDVLLLVGGIYLRNLIFSDLGYNLIDIDNSLRT
jgi:hypothetical protein